MSAAKTVAIIGAGPVGLAAAAHVLERGLEPIVLEAGDDVGHAMRQWGHVQLFSPWEYNIDKAAARLLATTGWNSPEPDQYPTGAEMVERYLEPLANNTALRPHIQTSSRVTGISRVGFDKMKTKGRDKAPFEIRYQNGQGPKVVKADAVIDASGTWHSPNPAGANGLPAIGETQAADRIAYGMPDVLGKDRARYAGKTVAVLGAGHSAIGTLTDLAKLAARSAGDPAGLAVAGQRSRQGLWRRRQRQAGRPRRTRRRLCRAGDGGPDQGRKRISRLASHRRRPSPRRRRHLRLLAPAGPSVDELIVATGFRPDLDFVRELRIRLDPAIECPVALAPLIDPNEHSCGTVRPHGARELAQDEPGFYFAGMKSYGRAPTFLMLTGYEQVRSIAADIAGDRAAAERVELVLPETGVCSRSLAPDASNCCGGPALSDVDACCVADEKAKQQGKTGCGCAS